MSDLISVQKAAFELLNYYGLTSQGWKFKWDSAKRRGGYCNYTTKTISMSRLLVPKWSDKESKDTLLHEVAHALVGPGHGHGRVWVRKVVSLGGNPSVTHDAPTVPRPWAGYCPNHGSIGYRHRRRNLMCSICRTKIVWEARDLENV